MNVTVNFIVQQLFLSRPLEEKEIFNVNILTDWDYRFNFAFLSDRVDFYTNDNTGKNPKL